jgi:hypothetical protein
MARALIAVSEQRTTTPNQWSIRYVEIHSDKQQ